MILYIRESCHMHSSIICWSSGPNLQSKDMTTNILAPLDGALMNKLQTQLTATYKQRIHRVVLFSEYGTSSKAWPDWTNIHVQESQATSWNFTEHHIVGDHHKSSLTHRSFELTISAQMYHECNCFGRQVPTYTSPRITHASAGRQQQKTRLYHPLLDLHIAQHTLPSPVSHGQVFVTTILIACAGANHHSNV